MKFVYTLQREYIPKSNYGNGAMKQVFDILNGKADTLDLNEMEEVVTGGYFIPDDKKTQVELTSEFLIRENKDKINASKIYLSSYFKADPSEVSYALANPSQRNPNAPDTNYIGKWSDNVEANAKIYYVIVDGQIRKLIFSKPIEFGTQTDVFGVIYIIEDDGNMVYCTPDEGDVMFDNLKEAKKYIKENYDVFTPLHP